MKNWLFFILMILFANCTEKTDFNSKKFDLVAVKKIIDSANLNYAQRFTNNDSLWYTQKYCKNACDFPPNEKPICSIDSLRKYFYGDGKNEAIPMLVKATNVYGSQEAVIEEGIYDFPDGKGGSFDKGKFIAIWKEEDGNWKLFKEIWNSDLTIKK